MVLLKPLRTLHKKREREARVMTMKACGWKAEMGVINRYEVRWRGRKQMSEQFRIGVGMRGDG